jgi:hypothetical protein
MPSEYIISSYMALVEYQNTHTALSTVTTSLVIPPKMDLIFYKTTPSLHRPYEVSCVSYIPRGMSGVSVGILSHLVTLLGGNVIITCPNRIHSIATCVSVTKYTHLIVVGFLKVITVAPPSVERILVAHYYFHVSLEPVLATGSNSHVGSASDST